MLKLFFLFSLLVSYLYGVISYKYNTFPLSLYREYLTVSPSNDYVCPISVDRNASLKTLHKYTNFSNYGILLGDSLFQGIYDTRPYGLEDYIILGQDGQTSKCLNNELNNYIKMKPKEIFLYIGGNDLDRSTPYLEVCKNISEIAKKITNAKIPLTLHEIHYGLSTKRDPESVLNTNKCINEISKEYAEKVNIISTLPIFKFNTIEDISDVSTDGEHLTHIGYKIWIKHIKKSIETF